eukprot:1195833-Prorocentrum_minimum.AAC.2
MLSCSTYTPRENQSQEGRRYILRARTNRKRGGGIYSAREPIARGGLTREGLMSVSNPSPGSTPNSAKRETRVYSRDGPIRRRKHGHILKTDQYCRRLVRAQMGVVVPVQRHPTPDDRRQRPRPPRHPQDGRHAGIYPVPPP